MRLENVNNRGGGCLGMCQENFEYRFEIQKQVPGTDQYVASH